MSTWGDVASAIAKGAPLLGSLVPGVGTVVGVGVGAAASIIASALGVPADPDSITAALKNDPDALAKVRQAELDNQSKLAEIAMQREQNVLAADTARYAAENADRASARQLAASQPKDYTRQIITYLLLAITGVVVWFIFSGHSESLIRDPSSAITVGTVLGYLFNELKQTLAYWFGSSRDSSENQRTALEAAVSPGTVITGNPSQVTTVRASGNAPQNVTAAPADDVYRGS
ncbi:hypothetical protein [Paraburkholderia sp. MM6662-R1]|uniref:hypothetical protein n=1 Tax=Paraburkholderia sp. MM6662-R1 TaxID=2991066 RepID=UPI003D1C040D